ncbi:hypothetical protein MRX96_011899 [Rhipicephalus microplus]
MESLRPGFLPTAPTPRDDSGGASDNLLFQRPFKTRAFPLRATISRVTPPKTTLYKGQMLLPDDGGEAEYRIFH